MARNKRPMHATAKAVRGNVNPNLISCGGGTHAYLVVGSGNVHTPVSQLGAAIDEHIVELSANAREALLAKAQGFAEQFPASDWSAVVDHLQAPPAVDDDQAAAA